MAKHVLNRRLFCCGSALLFSLALGGIVICCGISGAMPETMLDLTGYSMSFNETFAEMDISSHGPGTTWIAHTPWHGDFGDAVFDDPGPGGPFVTGAHGLEITAHKDGGGHWHSGLLASMDRDGAGQHGFAQRYGYFEMKAKLPSGSGTWPAFWLIGVNKQISSAEIDVVEYYGGFDQYFHSVEHIWQNGGDRLHQDHVMRVTPGMLSNQFNTYGVLIEPDVTRYYFDRKLIWSTPTPPEYQQPMYMLVNLAIGGGWPTDTLKSPEIMDVQYVRVYQRETKP